MSVTVTGIEDAAQRTFVEQQAADALKDEQPGAPGIPVFASGIFIAAAAWLFLHKRNRMRAIAGVVVLSAIVLIVGLSHIANVPGMFNDPPGWSSAHYSPGFGLIAATVAALSLLGLGLTAFVLERRVATQP